MIKQTSPGQRLRDLVAANSLLQVVGAVNAYTALLAQKAGHHALYLSGAGVANASFGLPDLAMTNASDVVVDIERITAVTDLPLLVDADTGWGSELNITRTIHQFEHAGAAGCHLEDQQTAKRCGHRPGKKLVTTQEMQARIRAAVSARTDPDFVIMARTDSLANEGLEAALDRCRAYIEAGADMIFAEAVTELVQYRAFVALGVPVLANITEFGKTPLFTVTQLQSVGVKLALYPLSAFRAMSFAAANVYNTLKQKGTQQSVLASMQTRADLYDVLNYQLYEQKLDNAANEGE